MLLSADLTSAQLSSLIESTLLSLAKTKLQLLSSSQTYKEKAEQMWSVIAEHISQPETMKKKTETRVS